MSASHGGVLKHHFEDIEQQRSSERIGMWMFLASEVLFFGCVFFAYTYYRYLFPHEFAIGSSKLNVTIAFINTLVLLTSSLTITLAIRACQLGQRKALIATLGATVLLGFVFTGFKAYEYAEDWHEQLVPGTRFNEEQFRDVKSPIDPTKEIHVDRIKLFFSFYYAMTGIHMLHLLIGVGVVFYLFARAVYGNLTPERYVAVETTSLYWHLVDVIWLFVMPLLYMAGPHTSLHF
jgi:cytochrome c oxidase subunit 3